MVQMTSVWGTPKGAGCSPLQVLPGPTCSLVPFYPLTCLVPLARALGRNTQHRAWHSEVPQKRWENEYRKEGGRSQLSTL